jgi:hypothetical protein
MKPLSMLERQNQEFKRRMLARIFPSPKNCLPRILQNLADTTHLKSEPKL